MCILKTFNNIIRFRKDGQISLRWNLKYNVYYSGSGVQTMCCSSHIVIANSTLLPWNWKCYVMYFINKILLLLIGYSTMEHNICFVHHLIAWWKRVSNICCESLEIGCISFGCFLRKKKSIINLGYVYFESKYGWCSKISSSNYVCF